MRRRLFTLLSAVSLVLCVTLVVAWVRAGRAGVTESLVYAPDHGRMWLLQISGDEAGLSTFPGWPAGRGVEWHTEPADDAIAGYQFGFGRGHPGTWVDPWAWPWLGVSGESGAVVADTGEDGAPYWYSPSRGNTPDVIGLSQPLPHFSAWGPAWLPATTAAPLPAAWVAVRGAKRWRRRRRTRLNLCPSCGFDLRASPGRCPECGAEPKGATA
jgi:hypothetical protein